MRTGEQVLKMAKGWKSAKENEREREREICLLTQLPSATSCHQQTKLSCHQQTDGVKSFIGENRMANTQTEPKTKKRNHPIRFIQYQKV